MNKRRIDIAVVGSHQSGKSVLIGELQKRVYQYPDVVLNMDEHHSHGEMDNEEHHVVLQVVDAMNLEEGLMMTASFMDHRHHLVLAVSRYDLLRKTGHSIDIVRMSRLIGVPIIKVSAQTGEGMDAVLSTLIEVSGKAEEEFSPVVRAWEQKDEDAYRAFMMGVLQETMTHPSQDRYTRLERINRLLTQPRTGFPILILLLCGVFWCTFRLGDPIGDSLNEMLVWLYEYVVATLPATWYTSLLSDGIILGVGSLLTALPNIIILFFFLSVMEDTGYMARVAYLMDGVMHAVGLHGRSFIPMLMGFDCNVPAIIAAKDIVNPRDRVLTMLMVPFMSCSARLPVYILFIEVFFPKNKALVLGVLYLIGVVLSFAFAWLMKKTRWFREPVLCSVNELPHFHIPTGQSICGHIWYRVKDFLKKISTVVLCASVLIWALEYFPNGNLDSLETSYLAMIGHALEPLMQPLGMDWRLSVCLLTGLPAKEAVAATFAILFAGGVEASGMTPVGAFAFLCFTLLYFPCVATISTLRREAGWRWSTFAVVHSLVLAWVVAFVVYQFGTFFVAL